MKLHTSASLLALTIWSSSIVCNEDSKQTPQQTFSHLENILDFCGLEQFFHNDISSETQALIQEVKKQIGYTGNLKIRRITGLGIRYLTLVTEFLPNPPTTTLDLAVQSAKYTTQSMLGVHKDYWIATNCCGYANAMSLPFGYLIINEDFLKTLPREEQKALIGHALIHKRDFHLLRKIIFSFLSSFVVGAIAGAIIATETIVNPIPQDPDQQQNYVLQHVSQWMKIGVIAGLSNLMLMFWHARSLEQEADIATAMHLSNASAMINLLKKVPAPHKSRFSVKRFLQSSSIVKLIAGLFSTHPSFEERIKYLEELAKQQTVQKPTATPSSAPAPMDVPVATAAA